MVGTERLLYEADEEGDSSRTKCELIEEVLALACVGVVRLERGVAKDCRWRDGREVNWLVWE